MMAGDSAPRRLSIFGSTGSIGQNTLDVVDQLGGRDRYEIAVVTGNENVQLLAQQAKSAGARFSFGTNNADTNLGRLEYPLAMVKECGLVGQDICVPRPDGQKKIQTGK